MEMNRYMQTYGISKEDIAQVSVNTSATRPTIRVRRCLGDANITRGGRAEL